MAADGEGEKPFRIPNHPFEFIESCIGDNGRLDISKVRFNDFLLESVHWQIGTTIEDVVNSAIQWARGKDFRSDEAELKKFNEFGATLRRLNFHYTKDTMKFMGHRFFLLAMYEYPDYAPVIILLLRYFLAKFAEKVATHKIATRLIAHVKANLNAILERDTKEDKFILKVKIGLDGPKLEALREGSRQHQNALRKRIVHAAQFFGFMYLNELIGDADFDQTFGGLNSSSDPFKYEAACNLLMVATQLKTKFEAKDGTSYTFTIEENLNIVSRRGKEIVNGMMNSLRITLAEFKAQDCGDGPKIAFEELRGGAKQRRQKMAAHVKEKETNPGPAKPPNQRRRRLGMGSRR